MRLDGGRAEDEEGLLLGVPENGEVIDAVLDSVLVRQCRIEVALLAFVCDGQAREGEPVRVLRPLVAGDDVDGRLYVSTDFNGSVEGDLVEEPAPAFRLGRRSVPTPPAPPRKMNSASAPGGNISNHDAHP